MRKLPRKPDERQKLIIEAVKDYFGEVNAEERKSITKIALWLMGRRKRNSLTEEEKEIKETIKANLQDKVYISGLTESPILEPLNFALKPHLTLIKTE